MASHDLNDLSFFCAVVDHNGFSSAARALNHPKSSISRRVDRLESRLGVRLLERSTRRVRLTEVGTTFYARCRAILADLGAAELDVALHRSEAVGIIRVSAPTNIAANILARVLPGFMASHPKVRVQLVATNRAIDLVEDNIDVAIRARMRLQDEALTMRRLGTSRMIFVASPDFEHAIPPDPGALGDVPFLSPQAEAERPTWTLCGPNNVTQRITFDPRLWTDDFGVLIEAARAGAGIALLPDAAVWRHLMDARLVQVFQGWHTEDSTVHLVFPTKRGLRPAVRNFIDYLVGHFELRGM